MGCCGGDCGCGDDKDHTQSGGTTGSKLIVDSNCIGCSACVAICDEVFELDDEGMSIVKPGADTKCGCVDDAISACPVDAIKWVD